MQPTHFSALWKHSLSPDLLGDVLTVLVDEVLPKDTHHALRMLCALRSVPRIAVVLRLVHKGVVEHAREVVEEVAGGYGEDGRGALQLLKDE